MAAAEIPLTGHLLGTGVQELRNLRLWQLTAPPGSPVEGNFWYDSDSGDKRIWFYDGSASIKVPRLDRDESVTGQWGFNPGSAQAPFTLNANAQGQLVTGLNADQLDSYNSSQNADANTVATRYTSGRLRVGNASEVGDAINLEDLTDALAALTIDASAITTGLLALARGGTNKDLSGAATGSLFYKDSDSFEATGALTGVLIGNGASAPSALAQLTVALGGTGAATASGARTNLDVLWADDARGLVEARSSRGGCYSDGSGTKLSGGPGVFNFGTGDFSFSALVRLPDYTPASQQTFMTTHSAGNNRAIFFLNTDGKIYVSIVDSGGTFANYAITPDVPFVDGLTYRITVTCDRDGLMTLYVNAVGDRDKNGTAPTVSIAASSAVDIGSGNANNWGHVAGLPGTIYELLAFNYCLSAAQVAELTTMGSVPFPQQWGSGTASYTSDFSAGVDSFAAPDPSNVTLTGNTDSINGSNDWLKVERTGGSAGRMDIQRSLTTVNGKYFKARFTIYNPSGSPITHFSAGVGGLWETVVSTPANAETVCEAIFTQNVASNNFRIAPVTSLGALDTPASGTIYYIKSLTVTPLGCVQALDLENARPSLTTTVKDRSTNNSHGTATTGFNQINAIRQLNAENVLNSSLTANNVVYAGTGGLMTGLAVNSGSIRFLTQASSGAPAWTDLFGGANTWTGVTIFSNTVSVSGLTTNAVIYGGASGLLTSLGLNSTATVKFLTQVSSGAPVWTDLYAGSPTWTGNHTFSGTVTVITPTTDYHAATKAYVDGAVSSGLRVLAECLVATTANITLSGEQTIDGVLTSASDVLVKNQTAPEENGIYTSAAGAWSRRADCDSAAEITKGAYTFVTSGTVNAGTSWTQTLTVSTLNTDPVTWLKFFQQAAYIEGTGIDITGQTISVDQSFSPTWSGTHTFSNAPLISTLTENQVLYSGSSGAVVGLGLNTTGTVKFLTQVSSAAPVWTDLYASNAAWTGTHSFTNASGVSLNPHGASSGNTTELRFLELAANGTNYVGFKGANSIASSLIWTLPGADGSANTYLKTNGSGTLSFAQIASSEISNSTFVTVVNGTADRITVSAGLTPTVDIAATYVGQTSITTLGTITSGTWNATVIGVAYGGTSFSSYTVGDMLYASGTTTLAKLAIEATAWRFLRSTGTAPAWSSYAMPSSIGASYLLYGSSTTQVSALSPSASRVLVTDASGVLDWRTTLPSGLTVAGDSLSSPAKIKWFDVGDGLSSNISLVHNFATNDVCVHIYEVSTGRQTIVASTRPTTNSVTLEFPFVPTSNQYRAAVFANI